MTAHCITAANIFLYACRYACAYAYASKATAAAATSYVVANTPPSVRVVFLGFEDGDSVRTGDVMETCSTASNPCRHALFDFRDHAGWGWGPHGRSSYDPLTTLFAVRGVSQLGMGLSKSRLHTSWLTFLLMAS